MTLLHDDRRSEVLAEILVEILVEILAEVLAEVLALPDPEWGIPHLMKPARHPYGARSYLSASALKGFNASFREAQQMRHSHGLTQLQGSLWLT